MYKITITSPDGTIRTEHVVKEYSYLPDEDMKKIKVVVANGHKYVIWVPSVDRITIEEIDKI